MWMSRIIAGIYIVTYQVDYNNNCKSSNENDTAPVYKHPREFIFVACVKETACTI